MIPSSQNQSSWLHQDPRQVCVRFLLGSIGNHRTISVCTEFRNPETHFGLRVSGSVIGHRELIDAFLYSINIPFIWSVLEGSCDRLSAELCDESFVGGKNKVEPKSSTKAAMRALQQADLRWESEGERHVGYYQKRRTTKLDLHGDSHRQSSTIPEAFPGPSLQNTLMEATTFWIDRVTARTCIRPPFRVMKNPPVNWEFCQIRRVGGDVFWQISLNDTFLLTVTRPANYLSPRLWDISHTDAVLERYFAL